MHLLLAEDSENHPAGFGAPGPVSADHKPGEKSPTVPPAGSTESRKSEPLLSQKEGGGEGAMEG